MWNLLFWCLNYISIQLSIQDEWPSNWISELQDSIMDHTQRWGTDIWSAKVLAKAEQEHRGNVYGKISMRRDSRDDVVTRCYLNPVWRNWSIPCSESHEGIFRDVTIYYNQSSPEAKVFSHLDAKTNGIHINCHINDAQSEHIELDISHSRVLKEVRRTSYESDLIGRKQIIESDEELEYRTVWPYLQTFSYSYQIEHSV